MGMFDSVMVPCRTCAKPVEFQSKAGECYCNVYTLDTAPSEVLRDIVNEPEYCRRCGNWTVVVSPDIPPGGEPPRPSVRAEAVRTPDNPKIHSSQDFIRWWPDEKPFTYDDIISTTTT